MTTDIPCPGYGRLAVSDGPRGLTVNIGGQWYAPGRLVFPPWPVGALTAPKPARRIVSEAWRGVGRRKCYGAADRALIAAFLAND